MNRRIVNLQTGEVTDIKLTAEEILAEEAKTAIYLAENPEYISKRQAEYPSIGDQLDALFHAGVFPTEMAALIQAVKDKYPKP